jgi:hypothetical protein
VTVWSALDGESFGFGSGEKGASLLQGHGDRAVAVAGSLCSGRCLLSKGLGPCAGTLEPLFSAWSPF